MFVTEIFSQIKSGKFQTKISTSFKKGDLKKLKAGLSLIHFVSATYFQYNYNV